MIRRVVVTGIGLVSPLGCSPETFWQALVQGQSGIRQCRNLDVSDFPIKIAGEVDNAFLNGDLSDKFISKSDRALVLCLCATSHALVDAGLRNGIDDPIESGCILGTGLGPGKNIASSYSTLVLAGWRKLRPMTIPKTMFNTIANRITIKYKLLGPHYTIASACSSSSHALGMAFAMIRNGMGNIFLTGGTDSPLLTGTFGAWVNLGILSPNPDAPHASRPFDKNRNGLVLSEGSAMLVLEELEHAKAREARIYAEIAGYGAASDATHLTSPNPDGQARAINFALRNAELGHSDIDYINAHGTATILNDPVETQAIKLAFGKRAYEIPVSSTKSMTGHLMGSSGALELIACIQSILHNQLPPTINLDEADLLCDLDYVPKVSRPCHVDVALSNSFAFGGSNSVLIVKRFVE